MKTILYFSIILLFISCKKEDEKPEQTQNLDTIAYCSYTDANSYGEIYICKSDGSENTRISTYSGTEMLDLDFNPIWSPDGTKILYYSYRDNYRKNIYVYDLITKQEYAVGNVSNLSMISNAEWSPDSQKIIYEGAMLFPMENHIFIVNADGTDRVQFSENGFNYSEPHWHPSGNWIYYFKLDGVKQLIKVDANTGLQIGLYAINAENLCFLKDGSKFVFRNNTTNGISILNEDFSNLQNLTTDGGNYPKVSPNQNRIAYIDSNLINSDQFSILTIDLNTGANKINLTNTLTASMSFSSNRLFFPSWSTSNYIYIANNLGQIYGMKDDFTADNKLIGTLNAFDFPQIKP